jgi:hypothetical protein
LATTRVTGLIATGVVAAGVYLVAIASCSSGSNCDCPDDVAFATLELPCNTSAAATARTTGPCSAQVWSPESVVVTGTAAGACRIELTLPGGAITTADVTFAPGDWSPCGSNPHGCGQLLAATPPVVLVEGQCPDASP